MCAVIQFVGTATPPPVSFLIRLIALTTAACVGDAPAALSPRVNRLADSQPMSATSSYAWAPCPDETIHLKYKLSPG